MSNFGIPVHFPRTSQVERLDKGVQGGEGVSKKEVSETTGLLKAKGDNFGGLDVELKQGDVSKGIEQMRKQSEGRLGDPPGFGAKVGNILSSVISVVLTTVTSLTTSVIGTVGSFVLGGVDKLLEKAFGVEEARQNYQKAWRDSLGEPMEGSILHSMVETKHGDVSLRAALDDLHGNLLNGEERVPFGDVLKYVAMGERIMHALSRTDGNPPSTELQVMDKDGKMRTVKPDLETTRAISWYLQAKAISDNSGSTEGAFLKEGAMIAKDPGNKLYNFLRSSNESYGRVSSHMKERSESITLNGFKAGWEGGFFGALAGGLKGQPLQYGIEDFDSRMPSKGGSLLFDKLRSSREGDETPEIYLKWEGVGMPKSIAPSSGGNMWERGVAFFRCLGHTFEFLQNKDPGGSYRGEKIEKGEAGKIYKDFKEVVGEMKGIDKKTQENLLKHVERYGASEMNRVLDLLIDNQDGGVSQTEKGQFRELQDRLGDFMTRMGSDLGVERKGGEVHVSLPGTGYDPRR